jgi:hypothetical protein
MKIRTAVSYAVFDSTELATTKRTLITTIKYVNKNKNTNTNTNKKKLITEGKNILNIKKKMEKKITVDQIPIIHYISYYEKQL